MQDRATQAPCAVPSIGDSIGIGRLTARNRLVATAHGIAAVVNGVPTPSDADYWRRLASGGVGMTIAGGTQVAPESLLRSRNLTEAFRAEALDGMKARADAMKSGGALAVLQLGHLGQETLGAASFYPFVGASTVRSPREPVAPRVLSTAEVREVVEAYRLAAAHTVEAGFDIIEIHAAHGYLIAQFLSERTNVRTDRYGGDAEGRVSLLAEIVDAIRSVSPETPIGVRLSVEPEPGSGLDVGELLDLVPRLARRSPFDYLNLSYGVRGHYVRDMATTAPPLLGVGRRFREVLDVPLLLCSAFRDVETITEALRGGAADMVGMARAYLADPDLPEKVLSGRSAEVRPCVACNEDCRAFEPTALCVVNPDLAPPGERQRPATPILLTPGARRRVHSVAVVGAGPAGLECATTIAAHGGRGVVLFEAAESIGGQLLTAGSAANRAGWLRLLPYYQNRCEQLGVELRAGATATPSDLVEFAGVVWAAGAEERTLAPESGVPVVASGRWLAGDAPEVQGGHVVVQDDGFGWWPTVSAAETALARGAASVLVVTPGPAFASSIPAEARLQLLERLRGAPFEVIALATIEAAEGHSVRLHNVLSGELSARPADLVVVVGERVPVAPPRLVDGARLWAVGDAVVPRRVSHAIAEGRQLGLRLASELASSRELAQVGDPLVDS